MVGEGMRRTVLTDANREDVNSEQTAPSETMWMVALRLFILAGLSIFVRSRHRVRVWGSVPDRGMATLILANHQHDLDGLVVPALLNTNRPRLHPVYCVASQRLFEPGFFSVRLSGRFRAYLRRLNLGWMFTGMGVLPLENQPLSRPDASLGYEIQSVFGNLRLEDIFTNEALSRYRLRRGAHLRALWSRANAQTALKEGTLRNLKPKFRSFIRERERFVIEHQTNDLVALLARGETLFLLPEGRYSRDGHMAPLRDSLGWLLPFTSRVYLFAVSYDLFRSQRPDFLARIVPFEHRAQKAASISPAVASALQAARPVTFTQLFSHWVTGRRTASDWGAGKPFTAKEVHGAISQLLKQLPKSVFVDPDLRHELHTVVRSALSNLKRLGLVRAEHGVFWLREPFTSAHFPGVKDVMEYHASMLQETITAAATALP